jgi:hypothetical protein
MEINRGGGANVRHLCINSRKGLGLSDICPDHVPDFVSGCLSEP